MVSRWDKSRRHNHVDYLTQRYPNHSVQSRLLHCLSLLIVLLKTTKKNNNKKTPTIFSLLYRPTKKESEILKDNLKNEIIHVTFRNGVLE